jgi:hypothetical protein
MTTSYFCWKAASRNEAILSERRDASDESAQAVVSEQARKFVGFRRTRQLRKSANAAPEFFEPQHRKFRIKDKESGRHGSGEAGEAPPTGPVGIFGGKEGRGWM